MCSFQNLTKEQMNSERLEQLHEFYSAYVFYWYDKIRFVAHDPNPILLRMLEHLSECREETKEGFYKWGQMFVLDELVQAKQVALDNEHKAREQEKQQTETRPYHPPTTPLPPHIFWNEESALYLIRIGEHMGQPVILKIPDLDLIKGLVVKARRMSSGKFQAEVLIDGEIMALHRYVLNAAPEQRIKAHDGDLLHFGKVCIKGKTGWYDNLYAVDDISANPSPDASLRQRRFENAWAQIPMHDDGEGNLVEKEATLSALPAQSGKNTPANGYEAAPSVEELARSWGVKAAIPKARSAQPLFS